MFKRKIYSKLLSWKEESNGNTALLIEGARRIGKSTVVESFAKNEYQSYILIDFSTVSTSIKALFEDISDLYRNRFTDFHKKEHTEHPYSE